jgi:pimeloyl-ACP methyl ester carboxylesterase
MPGATWPTLPMTDFVFMHGGGQGGWVWDETIAALQAQSGGTVCCLALDGPGCGAKRGRDTGEMAYAEMIAELVDDVVASGLRDIVLVGHSMAGMTTPEMAALRPDLFRRLIFVTASAPLPGKTNLDQMGLGLHGQYEHQVGWPIDPVTHTMEERFRVMFCSDMAPAQADAFLAKLGDDMWPAICYSHEDWQRDHLVQVPSSYVLCLKDMSLPLAWQERFAERLHADRLIRIDAGHQVMNTRPQALAEVLLADAAAPDR